MRNKFIYLLFAFGLFVSACEVNDLQPVDAISEETAFSTPELIELSMVGVYDAAQSGFYGTEGNNRGYIWGAAHVQQNDMRGADMLLINVFYGFTYEATYTPTTANNVNYWENGFRVINLANLFIEGVEGAVEAGIITEEVGNAYEAEARFLRAITYHEMLLQFARPYRDENGSSLGLPIHTKGLNSADRVAEAFEIGRSTVAEVYDFVLEDLNFAEANLPAARTDFPVTRAESVAAIAYKTRVYLHMGEWQQVISEGNKLIPATAPYTTALMGGIELASTVRGPWDNPNSPERIFFFEMSANDNLNTNAALPTMYGSPDFGARGEVAISPIIWNQTFWDEDDLRRSELTDQATADGRYYTTKYTDYTNWTDYSPVLRYAEVLLNVAEAEARVGNQARALALLNAVRDRAIAGDMASYTGFSSREALVQAILNERRIEFLAEGMRWKDIHRNALDPIANIQGIPGKLRSASVSGESYEIGATNFNYGIAPIPYSDPRFIWPIPASETSRNSVLELQQNPGY